MAIVAPQAGTCPTCPRWACPYCGDPECDGCPAQAWEAVELVIGGIGEAAQQAWSEDPENWTAEEIADEMATRRAEARRDEFGY